MPGSATGVDVFELNGYVFGSESYGPIKYTQVTDLKGAGWTWSDTNSRLTSYSYNAATDIHTFDLVSLPNISPTTYNTDAIAATGAYLAPRFSTPLLDGNGVALTSNDTFILTCKIENFTSAVARNWSVGAGYIRDQTSTDKAVISYNGGTIGRNLTGTETAAHVQGTTQTPSTLVSSNRLQTFSLFNGNTTNKKNLGGMSMMSSNSDAVSPSRTGGVTWAAGIPVYLNFFITTTGLVSEATGGVIECKLSYSVVRL